MHKHSRGKIALFLEEIEFERKWEKEKNARSSHRWTMRFRSKSTPGRTIGACFRARYDRAQTVYILAQLLISVRLRIGERLEMRVGGARALVLGVECAC